LLNEAPQPAPINVVEKSHYVRIVYPSCAVPHALLPDLAEHLVSITPFPKSIRERVKILLIHRSHQHRYRFLDNLVFDLQYPYRTPPLSAILLYPHPLDQRRHIAPICQPFMELDQVGFQRPAIVLHSYPAQARRAVLAQAMVGFSKKVHVHTVDQGRKYPVRMVDRLLVPRQRNLDTVT
jgi:hypothetical protein